MVTASMNYTDLFNYNATKEVFKGITNECFLWCKDQHLIDQNNISIEGLGIIALALISLFIGHLIYNYHTILFKGYNLSDEQKIKIYHLCNEFAIYLIIGFFIWFVWFQ